MSEKDPKGPSHNRILLVIPTRHKPTVRKGCYGIIAMAAALCVILLLRGMVVPPADAACTRFSDGGLPLELQQMRTKYYI
ncbi:MAG: hypothetical protein CL902_00780 [Dehalococcoidia bacterium]|nr:hypothetical protein [Dehalococcoidia bacterium]